MIERAKTMSEEKSLEDELFDIYEKDNTIIGSLKEIYEKGKEDTINKFVCNAITEFQKFDKEHGYPTLADISVILSDVAEELKKEKKND